MNLAAMNAHAEPRSATASGAAVIKPFSVHFPDEAVLDLRRRVSAMRGRDTTISSARLYWESKLPFFAPKHISIPVAVSAFPDELYQAPRSWTERAYPKLIHYNKLTKGGHFAAWEQPDVFSAELRTAFRSLRGAE